MNSNFARDMRAVRREREAHWQQQRSSSDERVLAILGAIVGQYRATSAHETCALKRQQNWDAAVSSVVDRELEGLGGSPPDTDAARLPRAVLRFATSLEPPQLAKTDARILRRLAINWKARVG